MRALISARSAAGIGGLGELALVGRLDAALGRDAADIGGGPGHPHRGGRARRGVVVAGDAEAPPHQHREDRDPDLGERDHPLAALADRAGDLVLDADREAGIVDQVEQRDVEQVAEVEVALELVAAVRRQRAAVHVAAVGRDHAHRMAGQADEARDLVGAPQRPDLEEAVLVGDQPDRAPHVEGRGALARHQGEQLLLAAVGLVGRRLRRAAPRRRSTAGSSGSGGSAPSPPPRSRRGCRPSRCGSGCASRPGPPWSRRSPWRG